MKLDVLIIFPGSLRTLGKLVIVCDPKLRDCD